VTLQCIYSEALSDSLCAALYDVKCRCEWMCSVSLQSHAQQAERVTSSGPKIPLTTV